MTTKRNPMAKLITEGEFAGYYSLPDTLLRENLREDVEVGERDLYNAYRSWQLSLEAAAGGGNNVWYRYSPGPGEQILGFNRSYLPFIDGFHYVRRDPNIDVRQQLYALENKLVPSSGNTELFNLQLAKVRVPPEYCPYYLDPCPAAPIARGSTGSQNPDNWCTRCRKKTAVSTGDAANTASTASFLLQSVLRWMFLWTLSACIAFVLVLAMS